MNYSSYRFTLNLHSTQSQTSIPVMLGDTGRTWYINLSDGDKLYFIENGCLAKLSIKRPTGTYHEEFCEIRDNTTIVYPFTENVCAVVGLHKCEITLYGLDGKILGAPRFAMVVSDKVINDDDINLTDADHAILDEMVVEEANRRAAEYGRVSAESERAARFDETVGNMNTRFDQTVNGMNTRFDETVEDMASQFNETHDNMTSRFDETVADMNAQFNRTVADMGTKVDEAVEEIKEEYKNPTIHIGPESPESDATFWVDTDEEDPADIDVVAKPGQIIAVKSVDKEGKPVEYKAVDLPVAPKAVTPDFAANEGEAGHILNRTHYVDENGVIHKLPNKFIDADWMATSKEHIDNSIVIPEQKLSGTTDMWSNLNMSIQPDITYDVHINDAVYPCRAIANGSGAILGNNTSLTLNDCPFCVYWAGGSATSGMFFTDGSFGSSVYLKVTGHSWTEYNTLPEEFLPESVAKKSDIPSVVESALETAKESGVFNGEDGAKGDKGDKGDTGATGAAGKDGTSVTVTNVSESTADGGSNTVTFSDGKTLTVKNGSKGSTGAAGANGTNGTNGKDGVDGFSPVVSLSKTGKVTTLSITDKNGTKTAQINDGADGGSGNGSDFTELTEIYPQSTFVGSYNSTFGCYQHGQGGQPLISGVEYVVIFDGIEYIRTAAEFSVQGLSGLYIGNGAILGNNTGEPFCIVSAYGTNPGITTLLFDANSHTVSIFVRGNEAYPYYINATAEWDGKADSTPTNYTFYAKSEKVATAFTKGREIKLKVHLTARQKMDAIYTLAGIQIGTDGVLYFFTLPVSTYGNTSAVAQALIGGHAPYLLILEGTGGELALYTDW